MFDIVTLEPDDAVVAKAIDTIIKVANHTVNAPSDGYRYIAGNTVTVEGDGGSQSNVLVIVGHAGADSLSSKKTWKSYMQAVTAAVDPDWRVGKKSVFLVACSTAGEGTKFGYGNMATEIKEWFSTATVWAASDPVSAKDLSATWHKL
ncbi:hypothetical protein [Massilia sp. BJB1822]|uniref:hypothetical protein n=1 Tax=Massilia sp. BJB1822 TaxID=2744470 RepID=UPI001594AD53|nr:hypothetical protein [Massilia sp. BJB1822]NVD96660.1 hypothetical protein [Massilia sp. BJB1822]